MPVSSASASNTKVWMSQILGQTELVIRYLSLDWIDALTAEVAASDVLREAAADQQLGVTQIVRDGPEGEVTYHLQVSGGEARFGAGPADPEDVRFEQDWRTAIAVATGGLNAQEAFISGRIRLSGDQQKLLASQPIFRALDCVFTAVREQTEYR
jgi:putative sterol carrier protein